MSEVRDIHISLLVAPPLPIRASMDEDKLRELADSIKRYGVLQNLVVVPANGKFEIVAGHRRYEAALLAGLSKLPCKIYETMEDAKYGAMLDENTMREELSAAEEGIMFLELAEKREWGIEQLKKYFGRSEDYINERAKLVREFPELMQKVAAREVNWSQAKAIMRCKQTKMLPWLIEQASVHGATARTIQQYVEQFRNQELYAQGLPPLHTPEGHVPYNPEERKTCVYCNREDDQGNMVQIPIHSYHQKDLREFLRATLLSHQSLSPPDQPMPGADSANEP